MARPLASFARNAVLLVSVVAATPLLQGDVFARVTGTWRWDNRPKDCQDDPHTISFTPDHSQMILSYRPTKEDTLREYTYDIVATGPQVIRGRIRDETRRDSTGALVVWDLVLLNDSTYCWHRADWPTDGCTRSNVRCPRAPREDRRTDASDVLDPRSQLARTSGWPPN